MTHVHAAAVRNISIVAEDKLNKECLTAGNIPGCFYNIGQGVDRKILFILFPESLFGFQFVFFCKSD